MNRTLQGAGLSSGRVRLRYRAAAVALALTVAVLLAVALRPAAAAQLPLRPTTMTNVSVADRCTPAVAVANGVTGAQATTVVVTGLGTRCGGRAVALTLFGSNGAALTSAKTTLPAGASGSITVTVPVYSPSAVSGAAVTIGTWGVPASWVYTPPAVLPQFSCKGFDVKTGAPVPCTASEHKFETWGNPLDSYNLQVKIETRSVDAVAWEVTINLADPRLGFVATRMDTGENFELVTPVTPPAKPDVCTSSVLVVKGKQWQTTSSAQPLTIYFQGGRGASGVTGKLFNCS